jgi:hypothetical protein
VRFSVEEGHVAAFCRALGVAAPVTGQEAPLTFSGCVRQQDPEHMRELVPTGPLASMPGTGGTILHASQRFEYFGPVRVGDSFEVEEVRGRTWTKAGRDGGDLTFTEHLCELRDGSGAVVVRATMVLVETSAR